MTDQVKNKDELDDGVVALLMGAIDALEKRVEALEGRAADRVADPLGPLTRRVLEFLDEHPGMIFNPLTIAANLDASNSYVSSSLQVLVRRNMIKMTRPSGNRTALYRSKRKAPVTNGSAASDGTVA